GDREMAALAHEEDAALARREEQADRALRQAQGKGAKGAGERGAIVEIRAGTGGDEAALFAGDILRMYLRHAERRGWKTELVEVHGTELGGVREAVLSVDGPGAWGALRHEGGVHRVQRVPATEAQGRIHTSAVSVVVLPQVEEVDVRINSSELRIDTFCSSGAGGQSVNTTYSAVRIVHLPTGITVQCQDERSQLKNKARAMKVLRARVVAAKAEAEEVKRGATRREQVRSGDRSEKIRTYNFPQNRLTDHRVGLSLHRLRDVMDGDLDELLASLASLEAAADA
ncbi:MAG: peptide chain release factor 1, partial [bacterium]